MDWSLFIQAFIQALVKYFTGLFGEQTAIRMGQACTEGISKLPVKSVGVAAAPAELVAAVRSLISSLVSTRFSSNPIIRNILLAFANNLPTSFLDSLWDNLFKVGAVSTPLKSEAKADHKVEAQKFLAACVEEDLKQLSV